LLPKFKHFFAKAVVFVSRIELKLLNAERELFDAPDKGEKVVGARTNSTHLRNATTPVSFKLMEQPFHSDQRAVCFAARAFGRLFPLLDRAHSTSQTARKSRACMVQSRIRTQR
jgi:hypothetical protein